MKKKAFTLVELLVVIAIVAILATAGVVGYTVFTEKARKSNAETELSQVKTLIEAEDFENPYFEITSGLATFVDGYFVATAFDTYEVGDFVTPETYATLGADQENCVENSISAIAKYSGDEELAAVADKLSYAPGEITMISTSNAKYKAVWDIAKGTITGSKR